MTPMTTATLAGLLERAACGRLIADTHHTRDYAGREHGFLRCEGELVPLAGFVLRVEGMPQDQGAARLQLVAAAVNALPALLTSIATLEAVDKAARAYANAYLVDEATDPELTGCPPEQNAAAVALFDALADAALTLKENDDAP